MNNWFKSLFYFIILSNFSSHPMQQPVVENKIISYQVESLKLVDFWLEKIIRMFKRQMTKLISDEEAQKTNPYFSRSERKYKVNIKLGLLEKIGLLSKFDGDLKNLVETMKSWWDEGLSSPEYIIRSDKFIKHIKKREGYQNKREYKTYITQEEAAIISAQDIYTIAELSNGIFEIILRHVNLDIDYEKFMEILKEIFINYFVQSYALPENEHKLKWCDCPKVSIGERVVELLLMLRDISRRLRPEECTKKRPLIYTSFGSGDLLHDYIALLLLNYYGYNYFEVNFIDKYYDETRYRLRDLKEPIFANQWLLFSKAKMKLNFFMNSKHYIKSLPNKNDILIAIDISEGGRKASSNFDKLINKTTNVNSLIYLINHHKIINYQITHS